MKEFLLVFRADYKSATKTSPEEMQANTQKWINWIVSIAAQNKLSRAFVFSKVYENGKAIKEVEKLNLVNSEYYHGLSGYL